MAQHDTLLETDDKDILIVFSDIETDAIQAKYLLQIAAVTQDNKEFNEYVNPFRILPLTTTNLTGLYYYKQDLYKKGLKLNAKPIKSALKSFMTWIGDLARPVMLVYHNGTSFDVRIMSKLLVAHDIQIPDNLKYFSDTLPYFRRMLKPPAVENHRLSTISKFLEIDQKDPHCGLADSRTLKLICEKYAEKNQTDVFQSLKEEKRKLSDFLARERDGTPVPKQPRSRKKKEKKEEKQAQ